MDNFLTLLYFERFKNTEKERQLMNNLDWPEGEDGRFLNVRNDQSISETREHGKMIDKLIEAYIEKIKRE